jgi:folate-binding protein YgfZ
MMTNTLHTELDAILHRAALAPLDDRAFLRITGADATRWLNGMVTNSVQALAPGEGSYNFLLNAQGRILGDCTIYREPDSTKPPAFLLEAHSSQLEAIRHHLDHFIIMDDVELTPVYADQRSLLVLGPEAPRALAAAGLPTPAPLHLTRTESSHGPIEILTPHTPGIPRFELRGTLGELLALRSTLLAARATEISPDALDALRILEATPLYGRDIIEKYLPQETNQPHALHFNKGCYLGQEIVERIRSRGQVHRLLTPLTLTGELPAELPTPLLSDAKPVGEITSAALVPLPEGDQLLALGYVRREALEAPQATHEPLTYTGGAAAPRTLSASHEPLTTNN